VQQEMSALSLVFAPQLPWWLLALPLMLLSPALQYVVERLGCYVCAQAGLEYCIGLLVLYCQYFWGQVKVCQAVHQQLCGRGTW
jgi:hypothetical protein